MVTPLRIIQPTLLLPALRHVLVHRDVLLAQRQKPLHPPTKPLNRPLSIAYLRLDCLFLLEVGSDVPRSRTRV